MVVNFTLGKGRYADHEDDNRERLASLASCTDMLIGACDEDARAYGELNTLWGLAEDDPARVERWDAAVRGAIAAPQRVMILCEGLAQILARCCGTTNRMLRSDLGVSAELTRGAARAAAWNVRINAPLLDERTADRSNATSEKRSHASKRCARGSRSRADERGGHEDGVGGALPARGPEPEPEHHAAGVHAARGEPDDGPGGMLSHFGPWISKRAPRDGLVSVSRRNLPEGQYKLTRVLLGKGGRPEGGTASNPWSNWDKLKAYEGGLIWDIIRTPEPKLLNHVDFTKDAVMARVLGHKAPIWGVSSRSRRTTTARRSTGR